MENGRDEQAGQVHRGVHQERHRAGRQHRDDQDAHTAARPLPRGRLQDPGKTPNTSSQLSLPSSSKGSGSQPQSPVRASDELHSSFAKPSSQSQVENCRNLLNNHSISTFSNKSALPFFNLSILKQICFTIFLSILKEIYLPILQSQHSRGGRRDHLTPVASPSQFPSH